MGSERRPTTAPPTPTVRLAPTPPDTCFKPASPRRAPARVSARRAERAGLSAQLQPCGHHFIHISAILMLRRQERRPARESSVLGSAAPPCSNKEIWEIRMCGAFFPPPCYCECALVRTSLRTSAPSRMPNCHSHANNAARNKSQNKSVAVEKHSAQLELN